MQRYLTGALWGRPVSILTETTAAIASPTGNLTVYRRFIRPRSGRAFFLVVTSPEVRATPLCVPIGGIWIYFNDLNGLTPGKNAKRKCFLDV